MSSLESPEPAAKNGKLLTRRKLLVVGIVLLGILNVAVLLHRRDSGDVIASETIHFDGPFSHNQLLCRKRNLKLVDISKVGLGLKDEFQLALYFNFSGPIISGAPMRIRTVAWEARCRRLPAYWRS